MSIKQTLTATAGAVVLAFTLPAQAIDVPGPLVDPEWLAENLDDVVVLQTTASEEAFTLAPEYYTDEETGQTFVTRVSGHIPGARFVDYRGKVRVDRDFDGITVKSVVPSQEDWVSLARSLGVNEGDAIVIVSDGLSSGDVTSATRTYWTFKYFGHDNMAILDGGLARWLDEGYEAQTQPQQVEMGDWDVIEVRDQLLAHKDDVKQASKTGERQLIDGRSYQQFLGLSKSGSVEQAGHVPNAKPYPIELYTRADGASAKFLPVASYESLMKANGINVNEPSITYCNTGNVASAPWFILHELMGNHDVSLYDASLHEYTMDGDAEMVDNAQVLN